MIEVHDSVLVQAISRVLIPLVQLYAVYIVFFGQYSPGGGFAAGVILGAAFILTILVFGRAGPEGAAMGTILHTDGLGLLIFVGVGGLCLIGGGEYPELLGAAGSGCRRLGPPLAGHRADADRRGPGLRGHGAVAHVHPGAHPRERGRP